MFRVRARVTVDARIDSSINKEPKGGLIICPVG